MSNNRFGLIGRNIGHSFSKQYFSKKFSQLGLTDHIYENFDISDISEFSKILESNPAVKGLNVTVPYKVSVIPFLDELSETAKTIGAVNTIEFKDQKRIGHNTDWYGFKKSIEPLLLPHHKNALVLGTGGASKAIAFALKNLGIHCAFVSRSHGDHFLRYDNIDKSTFEQCQIVVNTTPIGTFPHIDSSPEIPYGYFTKDHIAYDLIYNPEETLFLKNAKKHGAVTKNGLEMLHLQAEKAWEIWNS